MEFSICRGGEGDGRVIFYMFSATHQNAFEAFKAFLDTFIFFPCEPLPPLTKPELNFL